MLKILWITDSCELGNKACKQSGSWRFAMRDIISCKVKLFNITTKNIQSPIHNSYEDLEEYIFPTIREGKDTGILLEKVQSCINEISPDIIHIWGMESQWAYFFSKGRLRWKRVLLEIQGVFLGINNCFFGGLSPKELTHCFGIKDILQPSTKLSRVNSLNIRKAEREKEILSKFEFISTQSAWTRQQIQPYLSSTVKIFETKRPIRSEFLYNSKEYTSPNAQLNITLINSYISPFKGVHVFLKALAIIKDRLKQVKVNSVGFDFYHRPFYRKNGYDIYLTELINRNKLQDIINFTGPLDAKKISDLLQSTDVFVNPSFVESFSATTAEALGMGVPSVLSFAGNLPYFSKNKETALYYSPMDYVALADKIEQAYTDIELRKRLSENSVLEISELCSPDSVCDIQLSIYNDMMK